MVTSKPIKDNTAKAVFFAFGVLAIIFGAFILGYDWTGYLPSIVGFVIFFALVSEIGLKLGSGISDLKSLTKTQVFTLIVALIILINAVLLLPQISYTIPIISDIGGVVYILGGIMSIIEVYH